MEVTFVREPFYSFKGSVNFNWLGTNGGRKVVGFIPSEMRLVEVIYGNQAQVITRPKGESNFVDQDGMVLPSKYLSYQKAEYELVKIKKGRGGHKHYIYIFKSDSRIMIRSHSDILTDVVYYSKETKDFFTESWTVGSNPLPTKTINKIVWKGTRDREELQKANDRIKELTADITLLTCELEHVKAYNLVDSKI